MASAQTPAASPALDKNTRNRVWFGSLSGSTIEWFDFFLYALAAGLIFNVQFFPTGNPTTSLYISYISLAITFIVRPFGGVIFAHIGDKVGRKKTLVLTIMLMGCSTVGIGLLPTYETIGIFAPILLTLLRIVQGLAIGGEWGGALLLAYEYAPANQRGLYGAVPQVGITAGVLLASFAFAAASSAPGTAFTDYAWRIPFIASAVLVLLGLWIRNGLGETPAFKAAQESDEEPPKLPLADTFRDHWRSVLVAAGAKVVETGPFYLFAIWVVSYGKILGYSEPLLLQGVAVGALVASVVILTSGRLSDTYGRRPVFIAGAVLIALIIVPFFLILNTQMSWAPFVAIGLALGICWAPTTATIGTMTSEMFSARVRYTGVTLGYQIGACLAGGTMPVVAVYLLTTFDSWVPIAIYVIILALVAIVAVLLAPAATRVEAEHLRARGIDPDVAVGDAGAQREVTTS